MGHSEMLLAVAGLKPDEVKALTRKLASGDWSDFPKAQQAAFGLAYKLSREPAAVTEEDRAALVGVFGRERTVDLIYYVSWCNYMTRVADAFQLPLEKENAFAPRQK
jgi:alkylhydroperoxidase family enzyme